MKPHGTYKLAYRSRDLRDLPPRVVAFSTATAVGRLDTPMDQYVRSEQRIRRILDSLRDQIIPGGGGKNLRIRRVFSQPREVYRVELDLPELGCQRTTFLDRDALEELLAADDVRRAVEARSLGAQ
ncbi:MAG: hypothetical protein OEM49_09375 [Myxococcales bacterium]|nr:hypothetical protein [Myxococcales bacterium]MDH5306338.1 hypothetical protein [Myxococcales bacterium]MDH5566265.1 hypothetical protein [Myxococcales bacterium]